MNPVVLAPFVLLAGLVGAALGGTVTAVVFAVAAAIGAAIFHIRSSAGPSR